MISIVMPGEIERDWGRIAAKLEPAIARDPARQMSDVYRDLMAGDMALFAIDIPGARGYLVSEIEDRCFWVMYVAGHVSGGPKARRARMQAILACFIGIARDAGCMEMRLCGRDWGAILPPEWTEPDDAFWPNELHRSL